MVAEDGGNKVGDDLNAQRFAMLEDIAKELAGDIYFPTCFETADQLRRLLDDPEVSLDVVAAAVNLDPLVSTKLLNLANSAAFGTPGQSVRDVKSAISRLGLQRVRTTSMAIAIKQMLMSRDMVPFAAFTENLWEHSLYSASAAWVIARRLTRLNPDEALLAGMVHDIGAFYMLYRGVKYPELVKRPDTLRHLVMQWHESIGVALLMSLKVPDDIVEAIADHDQLRPIPTVPHGLRDVVYVANVLAGSGFEWAHQDIAVDQVDPAAVEAPPAYLELIDEIAAHAQEMRAVFV